jgi:hypothetical protein
MYLPFVAAPQNNGPFPLTATVARKTPRLSNVWKGVPLSAFIFTDPAGTAGRLACLCKAIETRASRFLPSRVLKHTLTI